MRIRSLLFVTALVTLWAASAVAQQPPAAAPAAGSGAAGPAKADADGVRRDPQGIKGISPFWEAIKKGDDAYVTRDYDAAMAAYREALGHEPQNPMGHYRLGEAALAKGDLKEARASWETAKRFAGSQHDIRAKVLFVLADLSERERSLDDATRGWTEYQGHAQAVPQVKTYPQTPPERKKRIETWKQLETDYASVKERIKKRLAEAEQK